jgi:hypothetical protein
LQELHQRQFTAPIRRLRWSESAVSNWLRIAAGPLTITFKDGSTALSGAMTLSGGAPLVLVFTSKPWFRCVNSLVLIDCCGL